MSEKGAEDEGFEPSRLSSTRVRDARTRPLCESSKARLWQSRPECSFLFSFAHSVTSPGTCRPERPDNQERLKEQAYCAGAITVESEGIGVV